MRRIYGVAIVGMAAWFLSAWPVALAGGEGVPGIPEPVIGVVEDEPTPEAPTVSGGEGIPGIPDPVFGAAGEGVPGIPDPVFQ